MGRRRPDAAPAAQGGQIRANGGCQQLQQVRISLEPVWWALFVPNRLTAAETRKRFLAARAHSGFRHFSSRLLVLRPERAAAATGGGFGRQGRWLAGRHRCGAGAVGYRLAGARLAADWPSPAASGLGSWRRRWGMRHRAAFRRLHRAKSVRHPSPAPPPPCWLPLCCCCCKIVLASADSFLRYFAGFSGACRDAGGGAGADGRPDVAGNC